MIVPAGSPTRWLASIPTSAPTRCVPACLKAIEREAGRVPEDKPREIVRLDIDLLSCDGRVLKPADMERGYVRQGLKELMNNG